MGVPYPKPLPFIGNVHNIMAAVSKIVFALINYLQWVFKVGIATCFTIVQKLSRITMKWPKKTIITFWLFDFNIMLNHGLQVLNMCQLTKDGSNFIKL